MAKDINFSENEVIKILELEGFIREKDVVKKISPDSSKTSPSEITVKRAIKNLVERGDVIKIKPSNFKDYGIKDKDGRATYLALKNYQRKRKIISKVLKSLESMSDPIEMEIALKELYDNQRVQLSSSDLNQIVKLVTSSDLKYTKKDVLLLNILFDHINKGIFPNFELIPSLEEKLFKNYEALIKKESAEEKEFLYLVIKILGLLCSDKVLDIIEDLIKKDMLSPYQWLFGSWELCRPILEKDIELYELQFTYKKDKNIWHTILNLRRNAPNQYNNHRSYLQPSEVPLQKLKEKRNKK